MRTAAIAVVLLLVSSASAVDPKPSDKPIATKDASKAMSVPEGFKVSLFAGEPDVVQPIAFTFDDRGRMWVVECVSYPIWRKDGKGSDRVIILEDTDGDGTHDKRTVFMDNGANLSGIELGFGGVWLCSTPNLVFVPILDGDKPGKPEIVLDGWNINDTKHNIFNSLGWGPDGWLYGCNGIQSRSWVGPPGMPKEKRAYMDCGVWRYHPTRKVFEAVAHGTTNPFGLDWDEYGEMFVTNCVIDHLFHFVPGGHYQRMYGQDANPHAYGLMKSCVDYKHWAGGDWTSSRTTGVGGKPEHSDAGGGHAHSGCAIYLGDNFPAEYRNTLFTANIHGNRLNNDGLARTPSGYKGVRRKDFLFANDSWFRGICVKTGPDGALYVSDWCDTGECHNYDKADTSNGRIYRVSYGDPKQWKADVSKLSDAELVKLQLSSNDWFVRHGRRVLQERGATGKLERDTPDALRTILKDSKDVTRQLRALWALEVIVANTSDDLLSLIKTRDEPVRAWVFRLLLDSRKLTANKTLELYGAVRSEEAPYVRLQIAGATAMRPAGDDSHILAYSIAGWDEADPQLLQLTWYAFEAALRKKPDLFSAVMYRGSNSTLRRNAVRYAIAMSDDLNKTLERMLGELHHSIASSTPPPVQSQVEILTALRDELAGRKDVKLPNIWPSTFTQMRKPGSHGPKLLRTAEELGVVLGDEEAISILRARCTDRKAEAEARCAAIELLASRKLPEFAKSLHKMLDDPAVRQVAVRGLAAFADAETPAAILKAYPKLSPEEKRDAVQTLAARAAWANALLDTIEKGDVPRADVPVTTARQILALNDKALTARLDKVWGKIGSASKERATLTKKWKEVLTEQTLAKANALNGRMLFVKHCSACHKMFGEGGAVGPEITGSQRANLDYVLENVLDPSAVVPNEFRMINFTLTDERLVSGIILRETKDAVTVRTTNETVIVPVGDIANRKQTNVSIMPDGLFDQLKPDEVRDLVAYLRVKEQVPIPK